MFRQLTSIAVLAGGRALQIVAQVISLRVATTLLTPANMGSVNQMLSLGSLFSTTLVAPVALYVNRGFHGWIKSGHASLYVWRFLHYLAIALICSIVMLGAVQFEWNLISNVPFLWVLGLAVLFLVGSSISSLATSLLNLLGFRTLYIAFSNLSIWASLGLAVLLFGLVGNPLWWMLGQYLGPMLACTALVVLFRRLKSLPATERVHSDTMEFLPGPVFAFAWPQGINLFLWWMQTQSYRFVLDHRAGLAVVGLYTVGAGLCYSIMAAYTSLFNEFYAPKFFKELEDQGQEGQALAWNRYANAYVPATILMGAFLIGGSPFLSKVFLSKEFQEASDFMIWPALTETVSALGATLHFLGVAKADMRVTVVPVGVGAIVAPVGVYFFAPLSPLHGTGVALLVAAVAVLLTTIVTAYGHLSISWPVCRLTKVIVISVPMLLGPQLANLAAPGLTVGWAIGGLLLSGSYMFFVQYVIAREWLGCEYLEIRENGEGRFF